ncbi:MAG: hypothetical protein JRF47_13470 [Deltaproteobacteria bacterium]|nr:hypothetical protein [Deltaproteobacteria bacterium]
MSGHADAFDPEPGKTFNGRPGGLVKAHTLVVTANYTKDPPDGLDDSVWRKAQAVQFLIEGREKSIGSNGTVTTRALYTDDSLFFLFKWKDPARSIIKQSWKFDGQRWHHLKGNEDRIALLFEITRINKFATRGCAITCHSPADVPRENWKFATKTAAEKGDLWHWKAARSAPYNYADDAWLTVAGNPTGSYRETGRRKDNGAGGDVKNQTGDGGRPLFMQDPAKKPSVPGFLLLEESVKITDYSIFRTGDIIPFRLPVKPSGSRFDVKAISRHADGAWMVMLYRKLNTGHEDDVVFHPMKNYSFALAVFDDSGSDHSKATEPMTLKFSRK